MKKEQIKREFPCEKLGYCPYGYLVEYFPLNKKEVSWNDEKLKWIKVREDGRPCPIFGHDCPVDYIAESLS